MSDWEGLGEQAGGPGPARGGICRVCETGWLPARKVICHCSKSVTHHWKPVHIMKEKLTAVTEHILPKPLTSETYVNPPVILPKEETGYERLLWHQVKQIFLDNKMIIVHRLQKYNIHKNLLPLFVERNFLLVSMETRAWETLHILKRVPQINMIGQGACINNVILSQQGFVNFAKLPSIITAQGESAGFFSVMTSHTSRLLQRGFVHLCSLLVLYVQQENEKTRQIGPDPVRDPGRGARAGAREGIFPGGDLAGIEGRGPQ
uniref:Large ribosomal subunit protein uL10m n=1 Tax=Pseudonaja textilis TaxID=8673 RepID=A0A670ZGL0_PSETE